MGDLAKQLAIIASQSPHDDMENPMLDEPIEQEEDSIFSSATVGEGSGINEAKKQLNSFFADRGHSRGKKKKKGSIQDLMERNQVLDQFAVDELANELDYYLDELDEDDLELRDSLISMGRKYQREHGSSAQSSEISKMYSSSEKRLKALLDEIARDKESLQKDIDQMRLSRTRNFKAFSDMISAKKGYYDAQLSIIKEMNSMKKTQYDLKVKEEQRKKTEDAGNTSLSSNAIRDLFSIGRGGMVAAVGGYENISGAVGEDDTLPPADDQEEPSKYVEDLPEGEGDRFLDYENLGVEYVLIINSDDEVVDVVAEDRDGHVVPDYPMPTDYMELHYDIDKRVMRATDDYHRNYKLRIV